MSNALLVIDQVHIRRDADGRYCLNDLHKAAGGAPKDRPGYWLANAKTTELATEIQKGTAGIPAVSTVEGINGGTFVPKEMVYDYAGWISAAFKLKVYQAYDALVTGQMNVQQQVAAIGRKQLALMVIEQEAEIEALTHEVEYQKGLVGLTADAMLGPADVARLVTERTGTVVTDMEVNMMLEKLGLHTRETIWVVPKFARNLPPKQQREAARRHNTYTLTGKAHGMGSHQMQNGAQRTRWDRVVVDLIVTAMNQGAL